MGAVRYLALPLRVGEPGAPSAEGRLLPARLGRAGSQPRPLPASLGRRAGTDERGALARGLDARARSEQGLGRTRVLLNTPVEDLVRGRRPLEPSDLSAIEEALLAADLGVPAVAEAIEVLRAWSGDIAGGGPRSDASRPAGRGAPFPRPPPRAPAFFSAALGGLRGRGQRGRQDDHHRQAGAAVERRGPLGASLRRRYVPRRGRGAARGLGDSCAGRLSPRRRRR